MRIIDVTHRLSSALPTYPGNAPFEVEAVKRLANGDSANVSLLHLGTHAGTHVDAPHHFFEQGAGVDALPLDRLVGPAQVIHVPVRRGLEASDFETRIDRRIPRLLIRTGNESLWQSTAFQPDYAFLTEDGARYLVSAGCELVGIDYLSVEQFRKAGAPAHHVLLGAGVIVVEGLDLHAVEPGAYELVCLPLPVMGADGAPARVILRQGAA